MIVPRSREEDAVREGLRKKKDLFLYGPSGAGKTFLVKRVLTELPHTKFLYSPDSSTIKRALLGFLSGVLDPRELDRLNLLRLKKVFYETLRREPFYLIFDHCTRIGPKYFEFLENLLEKAPIIIIARSPLTKDIGEGAHLIWSFEHLEFSNFGRKETGAILDSFKNDFRMKPANWELFKKNVFRFSGGNPAEIKEICRYAKEEKYRKGDTINFNLIDLDRKIYSGI